MDKREARPAGWNDLLTSGHAGRLALFCFGVWLHAADGLMVATLIPSIVKDIGGAKFVAWTFALYDLGAIVAGAASGWLASRHGLRLAMTLGGLVYLHGCLLSAIAPEIGTMLIGRLLQGLGGGGLLSLSFIALNALLPRRLMARGMAAISMVWGLSAFTGPLVGGVFADLGHWRGSFWFFALQAALLSILIFISLRAATAGGQDAAGSPPWRRLAVLFSSIVVIASAGIDVAFHRSSLLVLLGLALFGLFLRMDSAQGANRLLPMRPLDPRGVAGAALLMVICLSAASVAFGIYGPALMAGLFNTSALVAGYVVALSSIGWSAAAIFVSGAPEHRDGKLILCGVAMVMLSLIGFALALPLGTPTMVAFCALLEGAGFGTAWTFILRRATALLVDGEATRFASALPTVQRIGYAIGAASVGIIANAAGFDDDLVSGVARRVGLWIFIGMLPIAAIGVFAAIRFVRFAGSKEQQVEERAMPGNAG